MESYIFLALVIAGIFMFGVFVGGLIVYCLLDKKKYKRNGKKVFLSEAKTQVPIVLTSLISIKMQYKEYEKQLETLKKLETTFTPIECNSFAYIRIELDPPDSLLQNNQELAMYTRAFIENLKIIARITQRTYTNTKEVQQKFENNNIDKRKAIELYQNILNRDKKFIPSITETIAQGFVLWAHIRNKGEDPQQLYNKLRYGIIEKARQMYYNGDKRSEDF